jgi:hypothetical protein
MYISQVDLIYKFNWTTCFGLEDHLQVLRAKVCAMLRLKRTQWDPINFTLKLKMLVY